MPWADKEKNRAYQREAQRKRRANRTPEEHAAELAKRRAAYAANPEPHREASRRHKRENREQVLAYLRDYTAKRYATDPEFRAARLDAANKRKAKLRGVQTEPVSRAAIILRDGSRCHICGKRVAKKDIHLDHLVPIAHGGTHSADNLAVAHAKCNMARGAGRLPAQLRLVA